MSKSNSVHFVSDPLLRRPAVRSLAGSQSTGRMGAGRFLFLCALSLIALAGTAGAATGIVAEWNAQSWTASAGSTGNIGVALLSTNTSSPFFTSTGAPPGSGNVFISTGWAGGANTKYWRVAFKTTGFDTLTVSSQQMSTDLTYVGWDGPRDFKLQYSTNGSTWTDVAGATLTLTGGWSAGGRLTNFSLPAALNNQATAYLRWIMSTNNSVGSDGFSSSAQSMIAWITIRGSEIAQPPTDILLSSNTLSSSDPPNTVVGTFSTVDPNSFDTFTYSLVSGTGSTNNASFWIDGNQLKNSVTLAAGTYSIRVRVNDGTYTLDKVFSITVSAYPPITGGDTQYGDYISNVTFAGINNTSGNDNGYADFTSQVGTVSRSTSPTLSCSINVGDPGYPAMLVVWFDWNQDHDFNDADEYYVIGTSLPGPGPYTTPIAVPATAAVGNTRMRIVMNANTGTDPPPNSGSGIFWGDAEDYTIQVVQPNVTISGNAGVGNAVLGYTDGTPKTVTADGTGNYTISVPSSWSGTVTPDLAGYAFIPSSRSYTNVTANLTGQDYTAVVPTSTSLASAPNPSTFSQTVTLTATVTSGVGTPPGTVTFYDGAASLGTGTLSGGTATLDTATLTGGSHSLTASYGGSGSYQSSTSSTVSHTVNPAPSATVLASAPNPSTFGQTVTLTATVASSAGTPTGTVTFYDGAASLGTGTLSGGTATLNTAALAGGSRSLTAVYGGSSDFATSTSPATNQTVNPAASATGLTSGLNPSTYGQTVTFTATVTSAAGTPTGTVTFYDGAASLGSSALAGGTATLDTAALAGGNHSLTAAYAGSGDFQSSSSAPVDQVVNPAATSAALVSAPNPSTLGQTVTLTATVTSAAGTPAGDVAFYDGAASLGTAALAGGTATLNTAALASGSHSLTAAYAGSGDHQSATSPAVSHEVDIPTTTAWIALAPNPSTYGQTVTMTAAVTASEGTPDGTVSFIDESTATLLGTGTLDAGGTATFSTAALAVGTRSIAAHYSGSGYFLASASAATSHTVDPAATNTALSSAPNPSTFGQTVTLTATVASPLGTPTGTVTFLDGAASIGTGALDGSGAATLSTSALLGGTHSLTAAYAGDGNFQASTSSAVDQVVDPAPTGTALGSAPNPSTFGQAVTLTATVTSGAGVPTGTVTFLDGAASLGTGVLDGGGTATLTLSSLGGGTHLLTASYGGDGNYGLSTSPQVSHLVNPAATATALAAAPNPSTYGDPVTLTATVTSGAGTPAGTVTFYDGAAILGTSLLAGGTATFDTAGLSAGNHTLTAIYAGDSDFQTSTSTNVLMAVNPRPTTTALFSAPNPSTYGQAVTLTATVTAGAGSPTGTVTFFDGGTSLGSSTLDAGGTATLNTAALAGGAHNLTADYAGDGNCLPSASSLWIHTVIPATTVTGLAAAPNPSTFGQTVLLTATVTSGAGVPSGIVTFFDSATPLGTGALDAGGTATLSTAALAGGSHSLTAGYGGDGNFQASNSAVVDQVVNPAPTTTGLTAAPNPSIFGQAVLLTATVTSGAGIPSGTVTFYDGATSLGTGALDAAGTATLSTATLPGGPHSLTAAYAGTGDYQASTSPAVNQTVNPAPTTSGLTAAPNPSTYGQTVLLTATVTSGAGIPSGTVTFFDGLTSLGTGTLDAAGTATLGTAALDGGSHSLTAAYSGTADHAASTSPVVALTVNPAATATAVSAAPNPSRFGESVTFTAMVTSAAGTPSGTVQFQVDGVDLGPAVPLSGGQATASTATLAVGAHVVTAEYLPGADPNHSGSTGTLGGGQTVQAADTSTALASAPNPSQFGQAVTFTATVTATPPGAGSPSGTVTFRDGGTPIGTATLAGGSAVFATAALAVGSHTITADYAGDGSFNSSSGTLAAPQVVDRADTTTAVVSSLNPSPFGQPVTFTATVAATAPGAGTPSGTVTFLDGTTPLGTAPLAGGTAALTTATLAVGPHDITVDYPGDGSFNPSSGTLPGGQTIGRMDTATTMASSLNPSEYRQEVTFTASVAPVETSIGTPTGTVAFLDDGRLLRTVALTGGTATWTTSALSLGLHEITAEYAGDPNFKPSEGTLPDGQTVSRAATSMMLFSSLNPASTGEAVTFTATVLADSNRLTPGGEVAFLDGGSLLGTVPLSAGEATLTTSSLTAGDHPITAEYAGDRYSLPCSAEVLEQQIRLVAYMAHVASTDDWWSRLTLFNAGSVDQPVVLDAVDATGQVLETVTLPSLPPGRVFSADVADLFAPETLAADLWVRVTSDAALKGLNEFGTRDGLSLVSLPMWTAGTTMQTFPYVYTTPEEGGDYFTGITLVNTAPDAAAVILSACDESGQPLAEAELAIPGLGKYVRMADEPFPGADPAQIRFLTVVSDRPLAGFEIFGRWGGHDLAGMPALIPPDGPSPWQPDQPPAGMDTCLYHVVYPEVPDPGFYYTGVTFSNMGAAAIPVHAELYDEAGSLLAAFDWTVQPRQQITREVGDVFGGIPYSGAASLILGGNAPLEGFELYLTADPESQPFRFDGVPAASAGAAVLDFPRVRTTGGYDSQLRLLNLGADLVELEVAAFDESGNPLGVYPASLAGRGKLVLELGDLFPDAVAQIARLRVTAGGPLLGTLFMIAPDGRILGSYGGM